MTSTTQSQAPEEFTADGFRSRPKNTDETKVYIHASQLARKMLTDYGNVLNPAHWRSIQALADVFTTVCFGGVVGRFGIGLPTGTGKSVSAAAFIATLHQLKRPESVAVCVEKVAQLVSFHHELVKAGVPEEKIGVWYSDGYTMPDGSAPAVPITLNPESRQFLLLTHSRTRGKSDLDRMNVYQCQPRSLWIYDESLMATSHVAFAYDPLVTAVNVVVDEGSRFRLRSRYPKQDREQRASLIALGVYLKEQALPMLTKELKAQYESQNTDTEHAPKILRLPTMTDEQIATWQAGLRQLWGRNKHSRGHITLVQKLLKMYGAPIRIVAFEESALVSYAVVIPKELQRLVCLDASFSIRLLENMDTTITHVTGFEDVKDWSDVTLTIDKGRSGREYVNMSFPEISAWAIEKIRQYPVDKPILMLTFKDRPDTDALEPSEVRAYRRSATKHIAQFHQALVKAGIEKPERIQFLTFGNETSLSDYKHIPHVVFLGVLTRSEVDLAGAFLAQSRKLAHPLETADVRRARLGEQAHGIYQGLSRGTCRTIVNGKAQKMTVDVLYPQPHAMWETLAPVMRGCTPTLPKPVKRPSRTLPDDTTSALAVVEALNCTAAPQVSFRVLKSSTAVLSVLSKRALGRAINTALALQGTEAVPDHLRGVVGWKRKQRSLVRGSAKSYGFAS